MQILLIIFFLAAASFSEIEDCGLIDCTEKIEPVCTYDTKGHCLKQFDNECLMEMANCFHPESISKVLNVELVEFI